MHNRIFNLVENSLEYLGRKTGFSYNEINIIVYYFIIPFSWLLLLDIYFDFHYFKIAFALFSFGFYIGCRDFKTYSDWLFEKSVLFLSYFNKFGSSYTITSVWICVSIPVVVYTFLFWLILR